MKDIIERIKTNSFKVWAEDFPERIGTAFAISDSSVLTANHVVNPDEDNNVGRTVKLSKPTGEPFNGIIEEVDTNSDLARITTETKLQVKNPFGVVVCPQSGRTFNSEVAWRSRTYKELQEI